MATATFWGIDPGSCREAGIEGRIVLRLRFLQSLGWPYISEWLDGNGMDHVSGAPYHPQTQGKIGRWHQTLKNRLLLENYFLPGDLKAKIEAFSPITIISAITRACAISHLPTSTSGAVKPSCCNEKG